MNFRDFAVLGLWVGEAACGVFPPRDIQRRTGSITSGYLNTTTPSTSFYASRSASNSSIELSSAVSTSSSSSLSSDITSSKATTPTSLSPSSTTISQSTSIPFADAASSQPYSSSYGFSFSGESPPKYTSASSATSSLSAVNVNASSGGLPPIIIPASVPTSSATVSSNASVLSIGTSSCLLVPISGSSPGTAYSSRPTIPVSGSPPSSIALPSIYVSTTVLSANSSNESSEWLSSTASGVLPSGLSSLGFTWPATGSGYTGGSGFGNPTALPKGPSSKGLPSPVGPATASASNASTASSSSSASYSAVSSGYSYSFNASDFAPPSGTRRYPYGLPNPTGYLPGIPLNVSTNATCSGATFNIINGSLGWWYTSAIAYGVSTFSQQYNYNDSATAWTLLPATTTFNVTSALAQPTFSSYTTYNTYVNMSLVYDTEYTTATPVFVSTAVITQTAMNSVNATSGSGSIPSNVVLTPAPASTVLPGPSTVAMTALTNTPFAYFTAYAIDRQHHSSHRNGSRVCATEREIHTLDAPFAIYYGGPDPDGQTEVGGALPHNILEQLDLSLESVTLGSWAASPTLLVVMEAVYAALEVLAVTETAGVSLLPEVTLLTPSPALAVSAAVAMTQTALQTPGHFIAPTGVLWFGHLESSETSLDAATTTLPTINVGTDPDPTVVAFTAHLGASEITFLAPEPTGGNVITTTVEGSIVVATEQTSISAALPPTAVALQQATATDSNGLDAIVSAIQAGSGTSSSGSGSSSGSDSSGSGSGSAASGSSGSGSSGSSSLGSSGSSSGSSGSSGSGSGSSGSSSSGSGSSGSSGSGSGSSGSGTSSGGSGTNNNPLAAQSSSGIDGLVSAIESIAQQSASAPVASALADTSGSSSGGSSSGGSSSVGSSSGGSSSGGSSSGGSSSGDSSRGSSASGSTGSSSGDSSSDGSSSSGDSGSEGSSGSSLASGSGSGSSSNGVVPIPISIASLQAAVGPSSTVVLGTQTLVAGGSAITISGTPVSLGPSAVVVGTVTHSFIPAATQAPIPIIAGGSTGSSSPGIASVITVGGSTITQAPVPVFVIGGQTIQPGIPVTVAGTTISVVSSGGAVVIGSTTIPFAVPASAVTLTTAGQIITISPTPAFVVGGQTLAAGGSAITVGGTHLSLAPSASALVIGASTSDLTFPISTAGLAAPPLLTIGSETFTANAATQFLLASGVTLTPGGVATISGTTISLDSSASEVSVDGITSLLSPPLITVAPVLTVGGTAYKANIGSTYNIGEQTLTPGGVITVSGTTISLASGASAVVVNGVTQTLAPVAALSGSAELTIAPVLTLAGQTYTANGGSSYIISGQTLTPGGAITLSGGTTISLAPSASDIVINGVTSTLPHGSTITSLPTLTLNGQTYTANAGSSYVIYGQTLAPGGSVTLPGGTTLSLAPSGANLVINGITSSVHASPATTSAPALTIGGQIYTAVSGSSYIIDGQTLTPGGAVTLPGGTTISLAPSGSDLVINGVTSTVSAGPAITSAPVLTIAGQIYTAISGSSYIINGQTLTPGGTITLGGGTKISLAPSASDLVINGVTSAIAVPTITAAPILTIDGQTYTAVSGSTGETYIISGQTLTPGGTITISGPNGPETISLTPDGTALFVAVSGASTTSTIPTAYGPMQTAPPILTIGGEAFTALPGSRPSYLINGQTLTAGGAALIETIGGHVYIVSLSPSATVLEIEEVGPGGQVTATEYETLFPATIGRGTATVTSVVGDATGGSAASGATLTAGASGTGRPGASLQNVGSEKKVGATLACGAGVIALLAALL